MEAFADPIIGRLTGRVVSPLNIEKVRTVDDLESEMNKSRTARDDSRYDVLLKHTDDLFRGSEDVQKTAFENTNEDINTAERIAELNRIRVEEGIRRSELLEEKKEQKKEVIRAVTEKTLKRLVRDAVDSDIRKMATEKLSTVIEEGRAEYRTLQTDLRNARDKKDLSLLNETIRRINVSDILSEGNRERLLEQGDVVRDIIMEIE